MASERPADHRTGAFSIGIEEEYFLVDSESRQVALETPDALFKHAFSATGGRVGREFLQAQIEAVTTPCTSVQQARGQLAEIRGALARVAAQHGLAILACGTHPSALWRDSVQSQKSRYDQIMGDLQMIGHRNMLCGMHVHVELPDPGRRVEIMGRMLPYLPLFIALSTSSPFWQSRLTGLACYRLAAYDELPRTGLPDLFASNEEFRAYVDALVRAGIMENSSYLWWAIRPSATYPTLELRAPDCCTRLDDAIAIAALYRALARHLFHGRGASVTVVDRAIAQENKWRAQRFGVRGSFVTASGAVPVGSFLDTVIENLREDAEVLGCLHEVERCRAIVVEGTSADAQIEIFQARVAEHGVEDALAAVMEWIAANTLSSRGWR